MHISSLFAYEVLASGGYPTIAVKATLSDGSVGVASVPYGASAGSHESVMLTDGDADRYNGKGVLSAVRNVHERIAPNLESIDPFDQAGLDELLIKLDGSAQKSNLGGNAILAVSLAVAKAAAASKQLPLYAYISQTFALADYSKTLPQPMVVAIEGGKHADETTDLQEFCFSAARLDDRPSENIRKILETYHALKKVLQHECLSTNVGNEGAFAPNGIATNELPFEFMLEAIERAGYEAGEDIGFSVDAAASEFYKDGLYNLSLEKKTFTSQQLNAYYEQWFQKYPILTVEDFHHEDDWDGWVSFKKICDRYGIPLLGDDLTVTSEARLQKALELDAISAILIKLNQIGTLTETVRTCALAAKNNLVIVPSHRGGGETSDTAMVDVAVAVGARYIKVGPTRGERVEKYNRLMEIERELLG